MQPSGALILFDTPSAPLHSMTDAVQKAHAALAQNKLIEARSYLVTDRDWCAPSDIRCEVIRVSIASNLLSQLSDLGIPLAVPVEKFFCWFSLPELMAKLGLTRCYFAQMNAIGRLISLLNRDLNPALDIAVDDWRDASVGYIGSALIAEGISYHLRRALSPEWLAKMKELLSAGSLAQHRIRDELLPLRDSTIIRLYAEGHRLLSEEVTGGSDEARSAGIQQPPTLVFVHRGPHDLLSPAIMCARRFSPSCPILLLSDSPLTQPIEGVTSIALDNYMRSAETFARVYCHSSPFAKDFELFCFQRWFALKDALHALNLSRCVHLDSDVLLACDMAEQQGKFSSYAAALCGGDCGHTFLINDRNVLDEICLFMQEIFEQNRDAIVRRILRDSLLQGIGWMKEIQPVNDMLLLQMFQAQSPRIFGNLSTIINAAAFDYSLHYSESGYVMHGNRKKITWQDGLPYATHKRLAYPIRMLSLHFRGAMKAYFQEFYGHLRGSTGEQER